MTLQTNRNLNMRTAQKRNASLSYGIGIAKIVAGVPVTALGAFAYAGTATFLRGFPVLYYLLALVTLAILASGGLLIYSGINACRLAKNYQKIIAAVTDKNREKVSALAEVTGQKLTQLVRDLRLMAEKGFFPRAYLDLNACEFVVTRDNRPAPVLSDGDYILREEVRRSWLTLLAFPATWLVYAAVRGLPTLVDLMAAGALSLIVFIIVFAKAPKVHRIVEKQYLAPPPPPPVAISTGNDALDELLTAAMKYTSRLNELTLTITNPRMSLPIGELLNISKQIFAFVQKQPEKARQIRQFMNYYLPTTIKLLESYSELSRQPLKGDNIREAMAKIEDSMGGIVETFRKELDNLYRDKAEDISIDVDVMLAMMRQHGLSDSQRPDDGPNLQI